MGNRNGRVRLTERLVEAASGPPEDSPSREREICDDLVVGLRLAASKSGRKFFDVRFCLWGQKRCVRVGEWPVVSLKEARAAAIEIRSEVAKGNDPSEAGRAAKAMPTLAAFVRDEYLPHAKRTKKSWRDYELMLNRRVVGSSLGKKPLDAIAKRDVIRFRDEVAKETSPSTANRHHSAVSAVFQRAIELEVVSSNPARGIRRLREPTGRQRFLSTDELTRFLAALDDPSDATPTAMHALRVLALSGLRTGEVLGARVEDYDAERGVLTLPDAKAGGRPVVLGRAAQAALERAIGECSVDGNGFIFASPRREGEPISGLREPFDRAKKRAGIDDPSVTPHILRHSVASGLAAEGVPLQVIGKVLGHRHSKTTEIYAHLTADAVRDASDKFAKRVGLGGDGA